MSTELSSTDASGPFMRSGAPDRAGGGRRSPGLVARGQAWVRATVDVGALVAFRWAGVRGRGRVWVTSALALIVVLTVVFATAPAYLQGEIVRDAGGRLQAREALLLLPSAYLGLLVISIVSAASAGGGRELLPRDQGVAFPVSPTTDHLGALVMAPLNIVWLFQTWMVLGLTAFAVGPHHLVAAQVPVLLWVLVASAAAQVVAWGVEWLRRTRVGTWGVRALLILVGGVAAAVILGGELVPLLNHAPTVQVVVAAVRGSEGRWLPWLARVAVLVILAAAAVSGGAVVARVLARRQARDELRVESSSYPRRPNPASDLLALVRTDRAGVWRSVPLRRGFAFLALLPGLVALTSALEWYMLNILPGLVASGGALLFGVNAWCLDGRGTLWRDSLPVRPRVAFLARVLVLLEVLLVATGLALALASVRAGTPTTVQVVAVLCSSVVVTLQVVAGSMRWSVRRPFAVDMRSARATPAPPLTMVGYSSRLALVTTFTGMLFVAASRAPSWQWPVLLALPFLVLSLVRLRRTARDWDNPAVRSRVVTTVAG